MEPKLYPFHISQRDPNISESDGTADTWSDIWTYPVPLGTGIILQSSDQFAAYLEDASAEVGEYDCYIKMEVRDPSGLAVVHIYGPSLYKRSKEFQNRNSIARLSVPGPVKIYPRQKIVVVVKDNGAIDASDSHFDLFTSKVAIPLA